MRTKVKAPPRRVFLVLLLVAASSVGAFTYPTFSRLGFSQGSAPAARSSHSVPRRNLVDEHVFGKMDRDKVPPAALSTDEEFVRRVHLDLTGRIPTANAVREFLANPDPNKRDRLVASLIGSPGYVDRWTMWFGDLFRNTVYPLTVGGRNLFHGYLREFVQKNKPYNQVVTELLTATGDNWSVGRVNWLVREGEMADAEEAADIYDNLAARASQTFLGVRLMCISCHNGANHLEKIDLWLVERKRRELWGMGAFFAKTHIEYKLIKDEYKFNLSDGKKKADIEGFYGAGYPANTEGGLRPKRIDAPPTPVYMFTGEKMKSSANPRHELARMMTSDQQFARATVNRLWAHFMVRGIVEPVDGFDLKRQDPKSPPPHPLTVQPSHPELLEQLAREFQASGYNLQHIMKLITKSSAYQLSSRYDPTRWKPEYEAYFARKLPRLLMGEELLDAIVIATEVPASYPVSGFKQKVQWAMQLPGPEEPEGTDDTWSAIEFLNAFGRGDRHTKQREIRSSVSQPLALMNSTFVDERISASKGILARLLERNTPSQEVVAELFLATLSRLPTEQERRLAVELLGKDTATGAEDLLWSLLNKLDFIFNY